MVPPWTFHHERPPKKGQNTQNTQLLFLRHGRNGLASVYSKYGVRSRGVQPGKVIVAPHKSSNTWKIINFSVAAECRVLISVAMPNLPPAYDVACNQGLPVA